MKVTIFGTGYVGLVTGVCLAELGNDVICVDIDQAKIAMLQKGHVPIHEPGLATLLANNLAARRVQFTTDFKMGVEHGLVQFIAVGTPANDDGTADLRAVYTVAKQIGQMMQGYCLVINKSTVPVGTADDVQALITQELQQRNQAISFDIASNPEFLREGAAITDFMSPDRIIVGADSVKALDYLRELYQPLIDSGRRFVVMDTRSSELTKYASNAFLATKISFINELSHIAEKLGADIEQVRVGMTMDPRIGEHFLFPGCGYGGSCFPKDIQALQKTASDYGQELRIIAAAQAVNEEQKYLLVKKLRAYFDDQLADKTIAVWGLAFKPNTDDMREATSRIIIENLLALGATIQAYDPVAADEARKCFGQHRNFKIGHQAQDVLENADVLVIITEWPEFRDPNFQVIKEKLRYKAIFDGRNLYDPLRVATLGLEYYAIGRGQPIAASVPLETIV
jgi:UDPglucose 6-dehydrogenase